MVALSPSLSFSQVAARGRGTLTSLCARGACCTLKADVRSLSFAAGNSSSNNNNTQIATGTVSVGSPPRAVASPHLIAIVGGAVGAAIALAVILALVHLMRVRRKVERFRRSINVLGPELVPMPMPTLRPPDDVASIAPVAASHVSPGTHSSLANGMRHTSVRPTDNKRHSYLSDTTTVTSPIRPPRRYPLPPGRLTIDVVAARALQPMYHLSAVSQTPVHSPYGVVEPLPGPTSFPRHEPHSSVTQRATEH